MSNCERLNFLLTNRIPRRSVTLFMGWLSRLEVTWLVNLTIAIWKQFADDLRLDEAETQTFASLQECFTRRLRPGTRPIAADPRTICSPCDAEVGELGTIDGATLIQAKGFPYTLDDLICDSRIAAKYRDGRFVTLRLKSSMYHRFHAPCDCRVTRVNYISGDTWNVNPIALRRIERLFCKNERAVIDLELADPGLALALVPVAAILVASMRFGFLDAPLDLRYRGPNQLDVDCKLGKGVEMGYFQHGSTIIVLAGRAFEPLPSLRSGAVIRMGQPLLRSPVPLSCSIPAM